MNTQTATICHSSDAVFEQLLDQMTARIQSGELLDVEDCVSRHPEYADRIRRLLPAMQALVAFGRSSTNTNSDGQSIALGNLPETGVLGDFRIVREIGRGGMGVVYEAEQISIGRPVALKVLPFASMLDERRLARFRNEVRAAGQLHHTNIVPVYAVGTDRGVHFYAMQLVGGRSLAEHIAAIKTGRPELDAKTTTEAVFAKDPAAVDTAKAALATVRTTGSATFYRTAAQLGIHAAEALDHAHSCGVVHRDVKPSNLLLDERGCLWLADFGLATIENDSELTMSGDLLGTLRYMSPEQALGARVVLDHRTDIYSLGVTLYELLTLEAAFDAPNRGELLRQIAVVEPRPPRRIDASIPADLETIILKAMSKDASSRYATARQMADDLRRFLENKPIEARRPSIVERARKWAGRHAALVATAVLALALTAVVGTTATLLTHQAYIAESREHAAADANLVVASETIDRLLSRVAHDEFYQGDLKQAERLAGDATAFYDKLLQHNEDPSLRYRAAMAQNDLARIWELAGHHQQAIAASRRGIELLSPLIAAYREDGKYLDARGSCYLTLGGAFQHSNSAFLAEEPYRQAVADYELLVKRFPKEPDYQTGLGYALADIATLCWTRGRLDQAEEYFARADKLMESLPAASKDLSCDFCLVTNKSAMLMNRALVASDRGDTEQAQRLINQAIVFQTQVLHDKPGNPHAADLLFRNYWNLGEVCIKAGQAASAASAAEMLVTNFPKRLAAYRHAATLLIECARLTGHAVDRADTDPAPPKKSQDSEIAQPSYDGRVTAQNYLLRAEELVAHAKHVADKNPDSTIDFAMFLLLCKHESFRDAHTALELAQSAVRDYPERGRAWFALALADYRLGNWQAAEEAEKKSAKLSRGEQADKPEAYDWLLLSMIRAKQGRIDDAATWYAKAADWIAESKPNDQELLQLAAEAKLLSSDIAKQASTPEPK